MRLTPENKEKQRQKILEGAAVVLRRDGYEGVNLDKVMGAAGLTRGAFYAHFRSKAELMAEVAAHQHPLRQILAERDGTDPGTLLTQMQDVFRHYLSAENLPDVFAGCTVASLVGDMARGDAAVKSGFADGWNSVISEMRRGQPAADVSGLRAALILATGAVTTAQACAAGPERRQVLSAAQSVVPELIARSCQPARSAD